MTQEPLILSLDIGTSSSRAMLWDLAGREVDGAHAQIAYSMRTTPEGGVEMPAEELAGHVDDCVDQILAAIGDRAGAIAAVGVSTFWHALLGLDADLNPVTPVYNWADTRSAAVSNRLRRDLDSDAIRRRTGCVIHPSYYPSKLVWLRESSPDVYNAVARWVSPSEYLLRRWFGLDACRVSVSMASGTGVFNQDACRWDDETLTAIGVSADRLSRISDDPSVGLSTEYAKRWPALKQIPFYPATGDGACGNVGSGCLTPERFALNVGTSGAIRAVSGPNVALPPIPDGLWRYRIDRNRPIAGAAFSDGGLVFAWLNRTLKLPPQEEVEQALAESKPAVSDPMFLPFLAGERSMGWNPDATAVFAGLRLSTQPVDMARAALEAVALRFALAANRLATVFGEPKEIVASGGALEHSPAWSQVFADCLARPLTLAQEPEASSRGAALLAAAGLGHPIDAASARMGRTFEPDPARADAYREAGERLENLYRSVANAKDRDETT